MGVPDHRLGITTSDLHEMRRIFDAAEIARPRHCFRWNASAGEWELCEVAPPDRTVIATNSGNGWTEI